jgi:NADPH:quinone reductase-like Zn-dependent oxidoreductase
MTALADRIAMLPPEKRARLLDELNRARQPQSAPGTATAASPGMPEHFCCTLGTPGNFESIRLQPFEPVPPGPGQVQIRAKAVSLNFRDLMIAMRLYPPSPGVPSVMGSDYAAEVVACGEGVTEFRPGDAVMALSAGHCGPDGRIVEHTHFCSTPNLAAFQLVHQPENLGFEAAAGVPTVFLTSYYALHTVARLQAGERVLIHSATGGVGLAAIQVARWLGAEILATAGSESKRAFLESIGIPRAMDSRSEAYAEEVRQRTGGEGVDVILNTLAGPAGRKGLEILRLFGRFLQVDKADIARNAALDLGAFRNGLSFTAIDLSLFVRDTPKLRRFFPEIAAHLRAGDFAPVRTTAYPVTRLAEALTVMSRFSHLGKLVLTYD